MTARDELRFLRDKVSQLRQNLARMEADGQTDSPALDAARNPGQTQYSIDTALLAGYVAQLAALLAVHPELEVI